MTLPDIARADWRPEIEGWSEDILPYYRDLAPGLPPGAVVVEVGVAYGRSILFLAEELERLGRSDVELWAVDFWPGHLFREMVLPQLARQDLAALVDRIRIVRCEGSRGARLFDDNACDVVFFDSDHEHPGMMEHLRAWAPKVRSGGRLAGHDYSDSWPGVMSSVNEYAGGAEKVSRPTRTVWELRIPEHGDIG